MPYKDLEKRRESQRKYREKNREKLKETKRKYRENNPEKVKESSRKWIENNTDKVKAYGADYYSRPENILKKKRNDYKRKYNATDEQFDAYVAVTHCQVCGIGLNDSIKLTSRCQDHCHTTGKLRKVICSRCNNAEGYYKDDPESILKLYEYIKQNTQ